MAEGGQNKPQKVVPIVVEGFEINAQNVTFQKLQEFSLTLYEKLLNQRRERNYLLLERDKLRAILENTRHETQVAKDMAHNKDVELERTQDRHRQERKEVEEEVKYILYDHKINLSELKLWEDRVLEKTADSNLEEELEMLKEKRRLKQQLLEQEEKIKQELLHIKAQHLEELKMLKNKYDNLQIKHEKEFMQTFNDMREQLILKHEMEMSEVEERKNTHQAELKTIHKTRLDEMKTYFNSITAENLTVISNLKQSIDTMKRSKTTMSAEVKQLKRDNNKLKNPLAKSKAEVKSLTRQVINYEKDLLSLKNNKRMLKKTIEDTKSVKKQTIVALKKIKSNSGQDLVMSLDASCLYSLLNFKTQTLSRRSQLEVMVVQLVNDLRQRQDMLKQLSSDPDVQQALNKLKFEYLNTKQLSLDLALVCRAHDELLDTLEERLEELGIPEVLGFKHSGVSYLGAGPSGLVSEQ